MTPGLTDLHSWLVWRLNFPCPNSIHYLHCLGQILHLCSRRHVLTVPPLAGSWTPPAMLAEREEYMRFNAQMGIAEVHEKPTMYVHYKNRATTPYIPDPRFEKTHQ